MNDLYIGAQIEIYIRAQLGIYVRSQLRNLKGRGDSLKISGKLTEGGKFFLEMSGNPL